MKNKRIGIVVVDHSVSECSTTSDFVLSKEFPRVEETLENE